MRKFKLVIFSLAMLLMIFTSCEKDEAVVDEQQTIEVQDVLNKLDDYMSSQNFNFEDKVDLMTYNHINSYKNAIQALNTENTTEDKMRELVFEVIDDQQVNNTGRMSLRDDEPLPKLYSNGDILDFSTSLDEFNRVRTDCKYQFVDESSGVVWTINIEGQLTVDFFGLTIRREEKNKIEMVDVPRAFQLILNQIFFINIPLLSKDYYMYGRAQNGLINYETIEIPSATNPTETVGNEYNFCYYRFQLSENEVSANTDTHSLEYPTKKVDESDLRFVLFKVPEDVSAWYNTIATFKVIEDDTDSNYVRLTTSLGTVGDPGGYGNIYEFGFTNSLDDLLEELPF